MGKLCTGISSLLLSMVFVMAGPCLSLGQEAKIESKDGVTIVRNPKRPVARPGAPKRLILTEDLRIGDDPDDENTMFSSIRSLAVDRAGDIIVLDGKEDVVKVFDGTGRHLRTFGKKGEGPGEFQSPSRMYLRAGKDIVILDSGNDRIYWYSKQGECLREIKLGKYTRMNRAMPDSRGRIYGNLFTIGEIISQDLMLFDADMNPLETISHIEQSFKFPEVNPLMERFAYQVLADDRMAWARNYKYEIHIRGASGKPLKTIIKDYDPVRITEKWKERFISETYGEDGTPSGVKLVFSRHFPPITTFICDDRGGIFVCTFEEEENRRSTWDVFDPEGRYTLSFSHPHKEWIMVVKETALYSFQEENEDGIPVVKRYRMEWRRP